MNRDKLIHQFLSKNKLDRFPLIKIQSDASFRSYYRIKGKNLVVMDAPNEFGESVDSFFLVGNILLKLGLSAPKIYDIDSDNGFLLLEDFGEEVFSKTLSNSNEEDLYKSAINIIDFIHREYNPKLNKKNGIVEYSEIELVKEARLFTDWYLKEHRNIALGKKSINEFELIISNLFHYVSPNFETLVMRDYHVDNLFCLSDRQGLKSVGLIDFQDALTGSPVYDLVSLVEDIRRPLRKNIRDSLVDYFISLSNLNPAQIQKEITFFSVQRNLKILGIFSRLQYRDKKTSYMKYIPNGILFIKNHLENQMMVDLVGWLEKNCNSLNFSD